MEQAVERQPVYFLGSENELLVFSKCVAVKTLNVAVRDLTYFKSDKIIWNFIYLKKVIQFL
jgi:hypothetical protein